MILASDEEGMVLAYSFILPLFLLRSISKTSMRSFSVQVATNLSPWDSRTGTISGVTS